MCSYIEIDSDKGIYNLDLLINELKIVIKIPIAEFMINDMIGTKQILFESFNIDEFLNIFPMI